MCYIFCSFQESLAADVPRKLKKFSSFGCYQQKDAQYCRFSGYDLHYALYCKFPSWGSWASGASNPRYSPQILDVLSFISKSIVSSFVQTSVERCSFIKAKCSVLRDTVYNMSVNIQTLKCQDYEVTSKVGNALHSLVLFSFSSEADESQDDFPLSDVQIDPSELLVQRTNNFKDLHFVKAYYYNSNGNKDVTSLMMDMMGFANALKAFKIIVIEVLVAQLILLIICLYLQSIVSFSPLVLFSRWRNKISWVVL